MAKHPYKATNRKDYAKQMCWYLDREEKTRFFSLLAEWLSIMGSSDPKPPDELQTARQKAFQSLIGRSLPTPVRNIFRMKASTLFTETTAFQLGQRPSMQRLPICDVQTLYGLPNFVDDIRQYFLKDLEIYRTHDDLSFDTVTTWSQMRIQLKDPQDADIVLNPITVQAMPPRRENQSTVPGRYNFVLFRRGTPILSEILGQGDFGIQGKTQTHLYLLPFP